MWRELDAQEKERRRLATAEELKAYLEQRKVFYDSLSEEERLRLKEEKQNRRDAKAKLKRRQEIEQHGRPKRPLGAFFLFARATQLKKTTSRADQTAQMKELGDSWRQMPNEEKEVYQEDARQYMERYHQEMQEWELRMKELGREDLIRTKSQTKVKKVTSTKAQRGRKRTKSKSKKKAGSKSKTKTGSKPKKRIKKDLPLRVKKSRKKTKGDVPSEE